MAADRDAIINGFFERLADDATGDGMVVPLTKKERLHARNLALKNRPKSKSIWIFGYGSLIWNPAFHFVEERPGKLFGYRRRFCLKTDIGRGSWERPGLLLALESGGSCRGVAYRIAEVNIEQELDIIFAREMFSNAYVPTWVNLHHDGWIFSALTFVINKNSDRYMRRLDLEKTAQYIVHAEGKLGSCAEYLENTVASLDQLGIHDKYMHHVMAQVKAIRMQPHQLEYDNHA